VRRPVELADDRRNERRVPSAVVNETVKSSMRSSVPSTRSPDGSVTTTVVGGTRTTGAAPRPPPVPGISHVCCSSRGSGIFVAMPRRSPVGEWHDAHFAPKNASPAFASPTTMLGGVRRDSS